MPDIFEYEDFRAYLAEWLGGRKGRSQRRLAQDLGLAPSTLSQVLNADSATPRRLPERSFEPLCELLELDPQEARYLVALIEYGQAQSDEERDSAHERMSAIRAFQFSRGMTDRQYELFSEWHHAAIHELAHCGGFRADPAWIAKTLVPPITEAEAAASLELLKDLRMLEVADDAAGLRPTAGMVVDNEWGTVTARRAAARKLHRMMLARAADALDEFSSDERLMIGATVAVADRDVERVRARLLAAIQDVLEIGSAAGDDRDRVVEVMFQFFPLSEQTG